VGLVELRLYKTLERARKQALAKGEVPSIDALSRTVVEVVDPGFPKTQLLTHSRKSKLRIKDYNKTLEDAQEDYELIYSELILQASRSLRSLDRGDALIRRLIYEGRTVNDLLTHELLMTKGVGGFFLGSFDTFRDVSKVDLTNTTAAVDIGTESVRLPRNRGETKRHLLQHLRGQTFGSANLVVENSDNVSTGSISGQIFGNAFDSLNSAWQQQFITTRDVDLSFSFTFPVREDREPEFVSSVVIDPLLGIPCSVVLSYSPDGKNFISIGGDRVNILGANRVRLPGPGSRDGVRFLKFHISIPNPVGISDFGNGVFYTYLFGVREIEVYREAFQSSAILQSSVLTPISDPQITSIDKLSLEVDEELPAGTDITYEIAPDNDTTKFREISPVNRPRDGVPVIIDYDKLTEVPAFSNIVDVGDPTVHEFSDGSKVRSGLTFYETYTFSNTPEFLSVKTWLGLGAWSISKTDAAKQISTERGNIHTFTQNISSRNLYVTVTGEEIVDHPTSDGANNTFISPSSQILSPENCVQKVLLRNQQPDHCTVISRFVLKPSDGSRTRPVTFSGSNARIRRRGRIGNSPWVVLFPGSLPIIQDNDGFNNRTSRIIGQHVSLDYSHRGSRIVGTFLVVDVLFVNTETRVVLSDPENVLRESDADLLGRFESIDLREDIIDVTPLSVEVDASISILAGDVFVLDYKRPLLSSERVLPDTVVVSSGPEENGDYVSGRDFSLEDSTGVISRVQDGNIRLSGPDNTGGVRVTFSYEYSDFSKRLYETYFDVPNTTRTVLEPDTLSLEEGERSYIVTSSGPVDLSSTQKIELIPGTYIVRIVSKPAEIDGNTSLIKTDNAFYKTVNLLDKGGNYIFLNGRYFSKMRAYNSPMKEISYFNLTGNTPKGIRNVFAVKGKKLIMSFNPASESSDFIILSPGTMLPSRNVRLAVGYRYLPSDSGAPSGVILRATLRRSSETEDYVTPTLHSYNVRFLHGGGSTVS
jgi:hypothetical protein